MHHLYEILRAPDGEKLLKEASKAKDAHVVIDLEQPSLVKRASRGSLKAASRFRWSILRAAVSAKTTPRPTPTSTETESPITDDLASGIEMGSVAEEKTTDAAGVGEGKTTDAAGVGEEKTTDAELEVGYTNFPVRPSVFALEVRPDRNASL